MHRLAGSAAIQALLLVLLISGCTSAPILNYDSRTPAQILTTLHAAGVQDGRARFREIFCERFHRVGAPAGGRPECSDYLHRLSDEPEASGVPARAPISLQSVRFLVVPGFFADAAPGGVRTLGAASDRLAGQGYRIEYLPVSGGGGGGYNAQQIAAYFRQRHFPVDEKLVVIGHSKGAIDLLHFLVGHPDLARQVDAMVSYAGAVNGTPLAEVYPEFLVAMALALRGGDAGDGAGFTALKPAVQMAWLARHPLPGHIRYFSLAAFTNRDNISAALTDSYDRLAQIDPKNDGMLIAYDQILAGSTLLGYGNADHWALALPLTENAGLTAPFLATRNVFPREAMFEAVLVYVRETL